MTAHKTFAGIPIKYSQFNFAQVLLQSIPYDGTSTWGKGADKGFDAFLEAAENMELYDIETDSEVYKRGIHILDKSPNFNTPKEMYEYTYRNTKQLLNKDKFLSTFGGEHSISIGIIQAYYEQYENLTVLQLDAHADLRKSYNGSPYNHACALHEASQQCNLIQVGIRSMAREEKQYMDMQKTYFADDILSDINCLENIIEQITDDVYITLDLDVFDSSIMPATGTPEPGGLDWNCVLGLLKNTFKNKNVVGFDIVELAPIPGIMAPQYLAAKLYYKMLSYRFAYQKQS